MRTFVGFGFGAIQAGLFLREAHRSGQFGRLVVAEVMPDAVAAVRRGGRYRLNVATSAGVQTHAIGPVEILNPRVEPDRRALIEAVAEAAELATALPSVEFYGGGREDDVARILAAGLARKAESPALPYAVIYTAENHNHAAEILGARLAPLLGDAARGRFECLNTVIGKMSGVVGDPAQLREQTLAPIAAGLDRAFLVEEFNRILISRIRRSGFERGLAVFEEKPDLLPFEEAKLYGHNATHALLGYLLRLRGRQWMAEARQERELLVLARAAFIEESGAALCRKYAGLDPLFTPAGYAAYADDLLDRMLNPHLRDSVARVTRDTRRKLGWNDRLIGTLRLALAQGVAPRRYARGAAAAFRVLAEEEGRPERELMEEVWREDDAKAAEREAVRRLVAENRP